MAFRLSRKQTMRFNLHYMCNLQSGERERKREEAFLLSCGGYRSPSTLAIKMIGPPIIEWTLDNRGSVSFRDESKIVAETFAAR